MIAPDLDRWIARPVLHLQARRASPVSPQRLWRCASELPLSETRLLGRLIRWRIPGTPPQIAFGELFRSAPFVVLEEGQGRLVCGLVGRIWTLRRDYPQLSGPHEFADFHRSGSARVVFANWVEPDGAGAVLVSETRVEAVGLRGQLGVSAVAPLVRRFGGLVGSDGLAAAARRAQAEP
jgi:hypothetical protein